MRYLGIVDWVNRDKVGHRIAGVIPLYDVTTTEWQTVSREEFPTQGIVFWFQATADKDTLVYFRTEDNPGGFSHEFKVADPKIATEVIDLRPYGPPEKIRETLFAGMWRSGVMPSQALLLCGDNSIIGPVKLIPIGDGKYTFEHHQRHKIPWYFDKPILLKSVLHENATRLVLAESSLGSPDAFVDWDEDRLIIRRAITWAADRAKERGEIISLTRHLIEEAAEQLTWAGTSAELRLERYRLDRTIKIAAEVELVEESAQSMVEVLLKHPIISGELERLRENTKEAVKAETVESIRAEVEALELAKHDLERVRSEIEEAQSYLGTLRAQVDAETQQIESGVNKQIAEAPEKPSHNEEASEQPASILEEAAVLLTLLRRDANSLGQLGSSHFVSGSHVVDWPEAPKIITELSELRKLLIKHSKAAGVPGKIGGRIHSAFCEGLMPVLAGPRALNALEAYARVVCGGRIFRVHVSPSFIEPVDLFGKLDLVHGRFLPHASRLGDVIETARQAAGFAIVVIEGANRAPTESYLLPLIQCLSGKTRLKLFHPSAIFTTNGDRGMAEIQWPPKVLLSATLVEGPTTLPVTRDLWNTAVLVETDGEGSRVSPIPEVTELAPDSGLMKSPESLPDLGANYFEDLPGCMSFQDVSARFLGALSYFDFEKEQEKLELAAIESILLPLILSTDNEEERDEMIEQLSKSKGQVGLSSSEWTSLVRRIRRRVA